MESPSPTDRRLAWVRTSRHWLTLKDTDLRDTRVPTTSSDTLPGCSAGKIESWLLGCGPEQGAEDPSLMTAEPVPKALSSFEDDLRLGAEAIALNVEEDEPETRACPRLLPPPKLRQKGPDTSLQQNLSLPFATLGHSMASSGLSSDTSKTASSVSEVLQLCAEDAEETLFQLGFGCDEPHVPDRIPPRFFTFPSQLRGINFRLFLESQLRRLREEDPGLSLASRFRQVEVLTAMANAFYSLYSHVSKTPLQKLAPPEFSFALSPAESKIGQRFFGNVRNEPRSPVERFKDTVSKMCLYTGPSLSPRSDPASPQKCNSLPDVVGFVIGSVGSEVGQDQDGVDEALERVEGSTAGGDEEGGREPGREGGGERGGVRETDSKRAGVSESYRTAVGRRRSSSARLWSCSKPGPSSDLASPADPLPSNLKPSTSFAPVPRITQDLICPQIMESVRLAPFRRPQRACPSGAGPRWDLSTDPSDCRGGSRTERGTQKTDDEGSKAASDKPGSIGTEPSDPTPVPLPPLTTEPSPCRITITGWEGDIAVGYADAPNRVASTSDSGGGQNFLSPMKAPSLGQVRCPSDQQANSFELEEVHSAGEDDAGQADGQTGMAAAPLSALKRHTDVVLRGDSLQSDSSGYAEEDCNPSSL